MSNWLNLFVLFSSAFFAASLLPMQSEAIFTAQLISQREYVWLLLAVASAGNIAGALLNWWLGQQLLRWQHRRWFPVNAAQLASAQNIYQRCGYWSLLGSWLPIIGDPITLAAGVLREPLWRFLLLVSVAKIARYGALLYGALFYLSE